MSKQDVIKLISLNLVNDAFTKFKEFFGTTEKLLDYEMRYNTLEDDFEFSKIDPRQYRADKMVLLSSFLKYVNSFDTNNHEILNAKITMNIKIDQQINNGQVNIADVIAIGDKFAEQALKRQNYDEADTHLIKSIGALSESPDEAARMTESVDAFNAAESDPPKKAKAKNKILDFIYTYGVPMVKVIGRAAAAIVLAKYGVKFAELGITD